MELEKPLVESGEPLIEFDQPQMERHFPWMEHHKSLKTGDLERIGLVGRALRLPYRQTTATGAVALQFLKSNGVADSGYRINYNDDTEGVLIMRDGVAVAGIDASGFRVFEPVAMHGLPTSDPHLTDRLWNDAGTVKISAG